MQINNSTWLDENPPSGVSIFDPAATDDPADDPADDPDDNPVDDVED